MSLPNIHQDAKRHIEKIQNLNAICLAVRAVHKSFPAVPVQDIVTGRANAALDLMWDLAFAFEIEERGYNGHSGPGAVISWAQECASTATTREVVISDLSARCVTRFSRPG